MRLSLALLSLVAAVLVLAGCGSSKKSVKVTVTSATSTKVATVSVGGSSGDCSQVAALGRKFSATLQATGSATQSDAGAQVEATAKAFKDFADQAPASVKGDLETFATAFQQYADAIKGIHFQQGKVPSATDIAKLTSAAKALAQPDVQTAEQHLAAWVSKNCKGVHISTTP